MKFAILISCCLTLLAASAEKQPFERYQSILDRQMFGPLPPGFDPTKLPSEVSKSTSASEKQLTQEQEKLQSAIHFSMINLTPEGVTEVGFTDNSDPKVPVNYLLKVGETRNGWTVKEADAVSATMTIVKDEIEVSLSLGGNSASQANATSRNGRSSPSSATGNAGQPPGPRSGLLGGTLRSRRLLRQQAAAADEAKRKEEQAALDAERQAQAEQEKAQREAERAEQRQQLQAIQEELKRVREAKAASAAAKGEEETNADN